MLTSYLKLALRHLLKHRLYAVINILGLSLGLTVFLFSGILVQYESDHDHMFPKRDRIFTVSSIFSSESNVAIGEYPNIRLAYGPLLKQALTEAEQVSRSVVRRRVLSIGDQHQYITIRFNDPGFTDIFDFEYLYGDASALDDPHGLILTDTVARELFGRIDVMGESLMLDHQYLLRVTAVIKDVPADSHFNSSFMPNSTLAAMASIQALIGIGDLQMEGEWESLNPLDLTYILLPEGHSQTQLQQQIEAVYTAHTPQEEQRHISAHKVRPLQDANTIVWDALGFPVLQSIQLLGLLVLITACLNYTNLATAQSFGRTREVGLRKAFGAGRHQLLLQFLIESIALTVFAMLVALSTLEILIPAYNDWTNKAVNLNYLGLVPHLTLTTLLAGLLAGVYPAYLIMGSHPIDSLHNTLLSSHKGHRFRSLMVTLQFAISIFILAMVMIIYAQNVKIKDLASDFPSSEVVILDQITKPAIKAQYSSLKTRLKNIPGVQSVTFSDGLIFHEAGEAYRVKSVQPSLHHKDPDFKLYAISSDMDYLDTYNIKLLAGRQLLPEDRFNSDNSRSNIMINIKAAHLLGFDTPEDVIGHSFTTITRLNQPQRHHTVVGLIPNQYFLGVHTPVEPLILLIEPERYAYISLRFNYKVSADTLNQVNAAWAEVIPEYPAQSESLDFYFNLFFRIPKGINTVLAAFAAIAFALALFGLFGLAAFMAQQRTKEIGIRKAMGANEKQIVSLLIWQFSLPVIWSLLIAVPLAYLASKIYLDFFPEQITTVFPVIGLASITALLTAWAVIAGHALKTARTAPIESLRYE